MFHCHICLAEGVMYIYIYNHTHTAENMCLGDDSPYRPASEVDIIQVPS